MIRSFLHKKPMQTGLPPGTLVFVGEQKMETPILRLMEYNLNDLHEKQIQDIKELSSLMPSDKVKWLNIYGVHDQEVMENTGEFFQLNPMLLADAMHTGQRPKSVEYQTYTFVLLKMLRYDEKTDKIIAEQLSMVIGDHFLLTFQERKGDVFEPVRERLRMGRKRIRSSSADFLAFSLLDVVLENYLLIIDMLGEKIDLMEEELQEDPRKDTLLKINGYKKEINYLRKNIRPVREILNQITKSENLIFKKETFQYLRELQDLSIQANEAIDFYREVLADQLNLYHTTMSTKMNDRMKVLTIFSAIFIPLTFIAGIYGTNFEVLPELHFEYSYYIMLASMVIIAMGMLLYFWKKKWL